MCKETFLNFLTLISFEVVIDVHIIIFYWYQFVTITHSRLYMQDIVKHTCKRIIYYKKFLKKYNIYHLDLQKIIVLYIVQDKI